MTDTDRFTRAYLECLEWCGVDEADRDKGFSFSPELIAESAAECLAFQEANAELLAEAGSPEQNGHDFWLTRNRHGAGFWDRGYPDAIGEALSDAARKAGSRDVYLGDDGYLYVG